MLLRFFSVSSTLYDDDDEEEEDDKVIGLFQFLLGYMVAMLSWSVVRNKLVVQFPLWTDGGGFGAESIKVC